MGISSHFPLWLAPALLWLLEFNVVFWVSEVNQIFLDSVSVVALKNYLAVFGCSSTSTEVFQLLSHSTQIGALIIYTVHYGGWFAKLSCLKPYPDTLLLLLYLPASAQIFGKPACWTYFGHDAQPYSCRWNI